MQTEYKSHFARRLADSANVQIAASIAARVAGDDDRAETLLRDGQKTLQDARAIEAARKIRDRARAAV